MGKGSSDLPEDGALAEQDLLQDDMIVMGTDGLWDNIFEDQVAELAVGKTDMDRLAKNIAQGQILPLKGMCTVLSNTIKASTVTAKEIISMGWKVFGVILKEDWPQKVVSERNGCPFI